MGVLTDVSGPVKQVIRFGHFEADLRTGELRKNGYRIRVPDQPFRVLEILAARCGEMVTRNELQSQLWPANSFMDCEHGLNKAVNRLRCALGDDPARPRFIETIARRGYRFIVPIEVVSESQKSLTGQTRLLVLPFDDLTPGSRTDSFCDGLTEEVCAQLGRLNPARLGVIARTTAMRYRATGKSIAKIARELHVSHVMEGSVRRLGIRARITAQLILAHEQIHFWAESFECQASDILSAQEEAAGRIARAVAMRLVPSVQPFPASRLSEAFSFRPYSSGY